MFRKSFIFFYLVFVCGGYAAPISLPWSHEASFYVSHTAFAILRDDVLKEAKKEMGKKPFPKVYMIQENFLSGDAEDNAFLEKNKFRHFVGLQKTAEGRRKFFEDRMEVFTIPENSPRIGLRGQRGVRAKKFIKIGSFLGIVPGVLRHTEYRKATYIDLQKWGFSGNKEKLENAMSTKAASPKDLICYYEDEIEKNQSQSILYQSVVYWRDRRFTLAINQGELGPLDLINSVEKGSSSNGNVALAWVRFTDNLCPIQVAVSIEDIRPGEELLQTYFKDLSYLKSLNVSEGKNLEERKASNRSHIDSIVKFYEGANQTAKKLGINQQIQILPTGQDREVIDALSLFKEKKKER
ncbi:MAG: SET domain-containing protein [Alphaproteobacteria bacterium]